MPQQTPSSGGGRPRRRFAMAGLVVLAVAGCRQLGPAGSTGVAPAALHARAQTPDDFDVPSRELPYQRVRPRQTRPETAVADTQNGAPGSALKNGPNPLGEPGFVEENPRREMARPLFQRPARVRLGLTPDSPDFFDLPIPSPHDAPFSLIDYEPIEPDWSSAPGLSGLDNPCPGDGDPAECPGWLGEECLPRFTMRDDFDDLFPVLWDDVCSVFTWENAAILGVAAGAAVAIRDNLDGDVRQYTAEDPIRWGTGSKVLRNFGEFSYQLPVLFSVYGVSLWTQDAKLHEFSKAVLCAYGVSALATVTIKAATNTQRPTNQFQDGEYGFPSYHAASTFCIAAVVDEYYGWPAGLPCYVLAGLVGWSRIDQREHDLSDVVFGSVLGFVVGKSVAGAHLERYGNYSIYPYYDPVVRGVGFTFSTTY